MPNVFRRDPRPAPAGDREALAAEMRRAAAAPAGPSAAEYEEFAVLYTSDRGEKLVTEPTSSRSAAERELAATRHAQQLLGLPADAELAVSAVTVTRSDWRVLR